MRFQSLIGRLVTTSGGTGSSRSLLRFQSLIGRLVTVSPSVDVEVSQEGFNPL